jgi:hypothetical protein
VVSLSNHNWSTRPRLPSPGTVYSLYAGTRLPTPETAFTLCAGISGNGGQVHGNGGQVPLRGTSGQVGVMEYWSDGLEAAGVRLTAQGVQGKTSCLEPYALYRF